MKIYSLVWAEQYEGEKFLGVYPDTASLVKAAEALDYDSENLFFYVSELGDEPLGLSDHDSEPVSSLV